MTRRACPVHDSRQTARGAWQALAAAVLVLCLLLLAPAARAQSQDSAMLVADRVFVTQPGRLVAEGSVEAFFGDWRLRATRIAYDPDGDRITADGPLLLQRGDGEVIMLADIAEIDRDLRAGLIRSARVVLGQQVQVTAGEVVRSEGRFTEMRSAVASTCEICARSNTPLWEIRARRVIHDEEARQIYFQGAQFRMMGLPLAYLPHLRVPDPSLDRATGFLRPSFTFDTALGYGVKLPYFIALGEDRDLTVTPFISSGQTRTVELRYRQAFATGTLELGGALSRDTLLRDRFRYYGYAQGQFALAGGYTLGMNLIAAGDDAYLADYDYRSDRRLTSDLTIARVSRDDRRRVQALHFHSLRRDDDNSLLPSQVIRADWERRFGMPGLGGRGLLQFEAQAHRRPAETDREGRDLARLSALGDWRNDMVLPGGVVLAGGARLAVDHVRVRNDSDFAGPITRVTPAVMAELRWPLVRHQPGGASHVIEPVAQVIWSRDGGPDVPNDSARMPELDEGNLFSHDRFPSGEQRERGLRANLGASWTRHDSAGWSTTLSMGRILRQRDLGQFSAASALGGARSDWLAALRYDSAGGLSITNRAIFGSDLRLARNDLQLDWSWARGMVSTSVLHVRANPDEDRLNDASEWRLDAEVNVDEHWTARVDWRYDLAESRAARAGVGFEYRNECLSVDVSVSRNFGQGGSVLRATNVGLSVELLGFGGSSAGPVARHCAQ